MAVGSGNAKARGVDPLAESQQKKVAHGCLLVRFVERG
jgi:hypothetical protein